MYYIYGRVRAIPTYRVYRLYDSLFTLLIMSWSHRALEYFFSFKRLIGSYLLGFKIQSLPGEGTSQRAASHSLVLFLCELPEIHSGDIHILGLGVGNPRVRPTLYMYRYMYMYMYVH